MIDVDSSREQQITFSKPDSEKEPETREEAYVMVMNDVRCLTYGLATLISLAHENGFSDKDGLLDQCIQALQVSLAEPEETEAPAPEKTETDESSNQ